MYKYVALGFFALLPLLFSACLKKTLSKGESSIEGAWLVTQVSTWKGEFTENGHQGLTENIETGDLGAFVFDESSVEFTYLLDSSYVSGNSNWNLTLEKVKEGFGKTNNWVLELDDTLRYAVTFEDDTKNAERDAKEMTLVMEPEALGLGIIVELILSKD